MGVRVFVPVVGADLRTLEVHGRLEPPRHAHAVTAALLAAWPDADAEECDYAAVMAAAYDSLVLLSESGDPFRRRAVLAVDVPDGRVRDAETGELTAVVVDVAIPLDEVAAIHVDDADAAADVVRAAQAVPAVTAGDSQALETVALEDHELLWYARQELAQLLAGREPTSR